MPDCLFLTSRRHSVKSMNNKFHASALYNCHTAVWIVAFRSVLTQLFLPENIEKSILLQYAHESVGHPIQPKWKYPYDPIVSVLSWLALDMKQWQLISIDLNWYRDISSVVLNMPPLSIYDTGHFRHTAKSQISDFQLACIFDRYLHISRIRTRRPVDRNISPRISK